jgi:hypothetical protein
MIPAALSCAVLGTVVLVLAIVCQGRPAARALARFGIGLFAFAYAAVVVSVVLGGIRA